MTIDRVATNSQTNYMLTQIAKANANLVDSSKQVASGKVSDSYSGIGDQTAALESARAAADRASAYKTGTQLAITQTDLQDTQLTTLSGLAEQLKKAVLSAVSSSDGSTLMTTAESILSQAAAILNSTDANGNYLYGGEIADTEPFTASQLSDLSGVSVSDLFTKGTIKKTVQVGDGHTEEIGVLASEVATDLMTALQSLYEYNASSPLSSTLTTSQVDDLTSTILPQANTACDTLNAATAKNGTTYSSLEAAVTAQETLVNLYTGFVSDIEDADMATALTNLSNNQTALQAVLTVTSKLNELTLLNYLPNS